MLEESKEMEEEGELDDLLLPQCKIKRNYTCTHCTYYTQNPRSYLYHLRDEHQEKIRIYECPHCLYASKHSQKLQRHVHMVHVMGKGRTKKPSPLKVKKTPAPPPPPVDPSVPSPEEEEEDGDGEYRCSLCTFTSKSKTLVTRHEHLVHLKKKFFRCVKCNYVTHMRARYTKHVKYHSMPMIKCDLCDFRTPYKWNLDRHYKNHTGDGAFRCSLCNFTADIKQSLTVHEMNHHVPPVGQTPGAIGLGVGGGRRRNKVGASDTTAAEADIDQDELELLRLEREDEDEDAGMQTHLLTDKEARLAVGAIRRSPKIKMTPKKIKSLSTQVQNERHNFRTDFIHPDDIIHHKNGNVYIKNLKCRLCNFKAAWEGEMARHENKVHGVHRQTAAKTPPKKVPRPIPNLIPIQNKAPTSSVLPILRIPSVRARSSSLVKQVSPSNSLSLTQETSGLSEKDLNEICAKSCPNSALKDFASLIGGEDAFKTQEESQPSQEPEETPQDTSLSEKPASPPGIFKKKNASFFDKLKEKLLVGAGAGETCNLVCAWCGHESKCLSELVRHQKQHTNGSGDSASGPGCTVTQPSGAELSSTRCQRCRQRCKTSADLLVHLQSCTASGNQETEVSVKTQSKEHDLEQNPTTVLDIKNGLSSEFDPEGNCNIDIKRDPATDSDPEPDHTTDPEPAPELEVKSSEADMGPHPMENKVFVWNSLPQPMETESEEDPSPTSQPTQLQTKLDEDSRDMSVRSKSPISDGSMVGVETTPGYGAITSKTSEMNAPSDASGRASPPIFKKVFKCPHCSFWASTASRFHVHIVGHLNKKPFECSLCAYRSNWRWDITKHIRLKSARDISHERARVLMTDETGRRNYSKYNKFLQFMRVHESTAESSGSGRRSQRELSQGTAVPLEGGIYQQQPLPAPPRLTRAPTPSSRNINMPMLLPGTLRPPPPLKAAHPGVLPNPPPLQPQRVPPSPLQEEPEDHTKRDLKRPAKMPFDQEPQVKRPATEGKKTLWKCKKCNYRDSSRELVLAHVKEHYQQRLQQQGAAADSSEASVGRGHALFRCGHCHQVSNWKHVIQRHCRLKHSGDVRVVMGQRRANVGEATDVADTIPHEEEDEEETVENRKCEDCPFTCSSSLELNSHLTQHIPRPGAIFKCYFCPYYVNQKRDLLEHMSLHGVQEPEEYVSKTVQEKRLPSRSPDKETTEMSQLSLSGCDSSPNKRYRCVGCPYVSNSKSQFLYHKQFHRPRGAPFKCGLCSYNVSRRHLLHQHLRVHGIMIPPQKSPSKPNSKDEVNEIEEVSSASMPLACSTPLDTRTMMEIPLVWVLREGKFSKMFKCRYCPHVNLRKANIQEHEKMHRVRTKNLSEALDAAGRDATGKMKEGGTGSSPQVQQHRCPDCNYVCNNAGVLSSHAKVHQGLYGQVHCLVDASRSDEAQLEELNASIVGSEVEMKMSPVFQNDRRTSVEGKAVQELDHSRDVTLGNNELGITSDSDTNNAHIEAEGEKETKLLFFCSHCPARFLFAKELNIHVRFHEVRLAHRCESCTYTARQRPHLLAHLKVHTDDYQEKTNTLVKMYETSEKHPRPRSAVIVEGPGVSGPVWVVLSGGTQVNTNPAEEAPSQVNKKLYEGQSKAMIKQFSCMKCPARFFKSVALQYHISLHGGSGLYKCRHCDYAVKTYGNLVKHEMIHNPEKIKTTPTKNKNGVVPLSGTDLFQHKSEALKQSINEIHTTHQTTVHVDPQFGILMHGNPDFIYPMYFKNGRLKEKRYKCHKCPSAFEKREQYKVHLSLHGSKQRYKCEKCDYSVKYYANYIQHMRKHQHNEDAQAARKAEKCALEPTKKEPVDDADMQGDLLTPEDMPPLLPRCVKSISAPPQLSMADKQTMMLLEQRHCNAMNSARESTEELLRKTFWCPHCPYSSQRRDGVESHIKRHIAVSGARGNFTCVHCDYSVPQLHFLREHNKVHFGMHKKFLPEAYMKCDRIELWVQDECKENGSEITTDKIPVVNEPTDKKLLFQDNGPSIPYSERFYPVLSQDVLSDIKDNLDEEKVYIDIRTGESLSNNTFAGVVNSVALEEGACEANSSSGKIDADDADSVSTISTTDSSSSTSSSNSSSSSSSTSSSSTSSSSSSSSSTSSSANPSNEENKSASSSEENCAVVNNNEEVKSVTEDPESSSDSSVDS